MALSGSYKPPRRFNWLLGLLALLLSLLPPLLAGIFIPLAVVTLLALLPWLLDRSDKGTAVWFNREGRLAQVVVLLIAAGIILLTLLAWWG